jgi:hypothetical protein
MDYSWARSTGPWWTTCGSSRKAHQSPALRHSGGESLPQVGEKSEGSTGILTSGNFGWQRPGFDVAVVMHTGRWRSPLRMTDKRQGDERGKGYGAVDEGEHLDALSRGGERPGRQSAERKSAVVLYQEEAGYGRGGEGTRHRYGKRRGFHVVAWLGCSHGGGRRGGSKPRRRWQLGLRPEEGEDGASRVGPNNRVGRMTRWAGWAIRIGRRDGLA